MENDPEDEKKPKVSSKNPGGFFSSSRSDDLSDFAVVRVIRVLRRNLRFLLILQV
jgi:hypothetical protein